MTMLKTAYQMGENSALNNVFTKQAKALPGGNKNYFELAAERAASKMTEVPKAKVRSNPKQGNTLDYSQLNKSKASKEERVLDYSTF